MARYRKIDPRIWNDEKFSSLSHEAQRMFFFVLTHPGMTSLGAFRMSRGGMAEELGLDPKGFDEVFRELLSKGLLKYDERAFLVFAPNFLKYNPPENPNVVKGWAGALDLLPECPLKRDVLLRAKDCAANSSGCSKAFTETFGKVLETLDKGLAEPLPKSMPKQEQEQEQEQEIKTCPARASADACAREAKSAVAEPVDKTLLPFPSVMPEGWKAEAKKLRSDVIPEKVFFRLAGRYAATTERRTMTIWKRIYLAKVSGERFSTVNAKPVPRNETPAQRANREFEENGGRTVPDKYLPNGEIDWGILTADSVQSQCRTDNA